MIALSPLGFLAFIVTLLIVAGVLYWALDNFPVIAEPFRQTIKVLIVAATVIWVVVLLYQRFVR